MKWVKRVYANLLSMFTKHDTLDDQCGMLENETYILLREWASYSTELRIELEETDTKISDLRAHRLYLMAEKGRVQVVCDTISESMIGYNRRNT